MQRVDGGYLYDVGQQLQPLKELTAETVFPEVFGPLIVAEQALDQLLHNSIYKLRHSLASGEKLLVWIRHLKAKAIETPDFSNDKPVAGDISSLKWWLSSFETNLSSELGLVPSYLVAPKGGYDTDTLIGNGQALFQESLPFKVPEAVADINQATRCIAFEVPTAAGFHIHRANEAVLRRYFNSIRGEVKPPEIESMGTYLAVMRDNKIGDSRVLAALKDIKDLHRNPLAHPDHSLESVEEAIDLLGAIRAVIGYMLKEIPVADRIGPSVLEELAASLPTIDYSADTQS
jgi:hypothetical protein